MFKKLKEFFGFGPKKVQSLEEVYENLSFGTPAEELDIHPKDSAETAALLPPTPAREAIEPVVTDAWVNAGTDDIMRRDGKWFRLDDEKDWVEIA